MHTFTSLCSRQTLRSSRVCFDLQALWSVVQSSKNLALPFVMLMLMLLGHPFAQAQVLENPPTFTFQTGADLGFDGEVRDVLQLGSGQLIVVGDFENYRGAPANRVARLNADGTLDGTFTSLPAAYTNVVNSVQLTGGGQLIIGGAFNVANTRRVARLNADGTIDGAFVQNTALGGAVNAVAVDASGNVVAVGDFTTPTSRVIRFTNTGALDATFNTNIGTGLTGTSLGAQSVLIDGSNRILIGGNFTLFNGTARSGIVRLTSTGTNDGTFTIGTGSNNMIFTIALDAMSRIMIGGDFTTFNGTARNRIARLTAAGALDVGFNPGAGFNNTVNTIAMEPTTQNIIVGGGFSTYNGAARNNIVRILPAGTTDFRFNPGTGFTGGVIKVMVQADRKLVVGGQFTAFNNPTPNRNRLARFFYASSAFAASRTFVEVPANDGTTTTALTIQLGPAAPTAPDDFEEWTASVAMGGTFTLGTHYTVANVPPGMTVNIVKTTNKIATVTLTGTATNHANINDVNNMRITWQNAALLGNNAVGVENLNNDPTTGNPLDWIVDFRDPGTAMYSGTTFPEDAANNGTITTVRTITLTNVTFNAGIANGTVLTAGGTHYTVAGGPIPAGMTLVVTKTGANTATIALTGTATAHTMANNVSFNLVFANAAMEAGAVAASVTGLNGTALPIQFLDPGTAAYSGTTFPEAAANDGSVTQTRTITLTGEQWTTGVAIGTPLTGGGVHYSVVNVPLGLTAVVTKTAANTADISFTGNAAAHAAANSVPNVQFNFTGAAIQSGSIATGLNAVNHAINFNNPGSAAYSGTDFPEAAANDGSITQTRTITLTNELWTTGVAIGANLMVGVHYNVVNVPAGLTAVVTKTSANVATISLTGNATAHLPANSITNMEFAFLDAALASGSVTGVTGLNSQMLSVTYGGAGSATYSGTTFPEAGANNGTVTQTRTITLMGEQWTNGVAIGGNLVAGTHYNVVNVPPGLTAVVTKTSAGVGTISFTGAATAHANANDVANVEFSFLNAAMQSGSAVGVTGLNLQMLSVDFNDPGAGGTYGGTVFTEAGVNNGSVTMTNTITLAGEEWRTAVPIGGTLTAGADYTVVNVPPGLTMVITKTSANVGTISFTGNAATHLAANSVNNVQITFNPAAVASGNLAGLNGQNLDINFNNPAAGSAAYSGTTFPEVALNNGTITTTRTITLTGDTWVTAVGVGMPLVAGTHYSAVNVPPGMTAVLTKTAANVVTIALTGTATNHAVANSVANMEFTFTNAAVNSLDAAATTGLNGQNLAVNFNDPASAAYSGTTFSESVANDGSIANSRTITLTAETWTAGVPVGGALVNGTHYNVVNLPAGLTPVLVKTSPTQVTVLLTGNAAPHLAANSVNNMQFAFLNAAVTGGVPASVTGLNGQNLNVNFLDVPPTGSAVWSGLTFNEAAANDGSITQTRTVTLTGETWAAAIPVGNTLTAGVHFNAVNVPAGLAMVVTKTSANVATVSFTGNAAAHAAANSVTNVQPTFLNASLQGGVAGAITDLNGQNLSITFVNSPPPSAVYSGTVFNENGSNNGTVPTTQNITLSNDLWTAGVANGSPLVAGTHYNVANVPAGLTMVITKNSPSQATISFTGTATNHTTADNVGNVLITFLNASVQGANAPAVTGLNGQNLSITYITGTATFASGTTLTGTPSGGVTGNLPIDITGDTFTAGVPNGSTFTPGVHFNITGVPPGLTPIVTKVSPTQAVVTFVGTANPVPDGPVNGIQISFTPAALTSGNPGSIVGLNGQNLGISFPVIPAVPTTPRINGVNPSCGWGGVQVRIGGSGFIGATAVRFGTIPARSFTVLNNNFILAVVDTTDGGTVEVITPTGAVQAFGFTACAQPPQTAVVTSISPQRFSFGTEVVLSGVNLEGATQVLIGGVPVQSFTQDPDGTIRAIVGGVPLSDQIQVITNRPGIVSVPTTFGGLGGEYIRPQAPNIIAVVPSPLRSSGNDTTLVLRGFNFSPQARVMIDGNAPLPVISIVGGTQATVTLPAGLRFPGDRRITLTNPDNQSSSIGLRIEPGPSPTLSVVPAISTMATGSPFTVRLTGSNFFPTSQFTLDGIPLRGQVVSPQLALVEIPGVLNTTSRQGTLRVLNTDGQSASVPVTITRRPPPFISTAESTPTQGNWQIILRGRNFQQGATVNLGGTPLGILASSPDSIIYALAPLNYSIPSNSTASIIVTNPDGQSYGIVLPPFMFQNRGGITNGLVPDGNQPEMRELRVNVPQAIVTTSTLQPFSVTIYGTGFLPMTQLTLDGVPVPITRYISPREMIVEIPASVNTPRTTTLRMLNPDGQTASVPVRIDNRPLPEMWTITTLPTPMGMQVVVYGANFGPSPTLTIAGLPARIIGNNDSTIVAFAQTPPGGFDCRIPTPCALTNPAGARATASVDAGKFCNPCGSTTQVPVSRASFSTASAPKDASLTTSHTASQTSSQASSHQSSATEQLAQMIFANEVAAKEMFGSVRISPNPTSDMVNIDGLKELTSEPVTVRFLDAKGAVIKESRGERSIDVSTMASGVYCVELSTERGKRWVTRVVIRH
ncbi:MAG: T9SS type A sorting domain-containing protein [Candidatus Kapabacteria bacterium]|nr:T9SS type A sorting domain-containing protein [Candidatus Kapabacteria bacterium]